MKSYTSISMRSIITFFEDSVGKYANNPFLWEKQNGVFQSMSYSQTHARVEILANGFLSQGLEYADRVALLSEGCPNWLISELAVLFCGAINVPLSTKLEGDNELIFRINHSGSRFIVVSPTQLSKIRLVRAELKQVEKIFVMDGCDKLEDGEYLLSDLFEKGKAFSQQFPLSLAERKVSVKPDTVANIT